MEDIRIKLTLPEDNEGLRRRELNAQDDSVYLKSNIPSLLLENCFFNPAIVRISKCVHEEAAPLLYGLNQFRFEGVDGWNDLFYFQQRLLPTSRSHLRLLQLQFPDLFSYNHAELSMTTSFTSRVEACLESINGLSNLEELRLCLGERIGMCHEVFTQIDLSNIPSINAKRGIIKVIIKNETPLDRDAELYCWKIMRSLGFMRKLNEWGWIGWELNR